MSHTVKINSSFKTEHTNALKRALENFGWSLKENSKINTYPSDPGRNKVYPMIMQNPKGYDIGLLFNEQTGEIELYGDFFDGSIQKSLGNNIDKLKQEYSCCVAEDQLAYMGYSTSRAVNQETGEVTVNFEQ
jgi:hypothetical protein